MEISVSSSRKHVTDVTESFLESTHPFFKILIGLFKLGDLGVLFGAKLAEGVDGEGFET